jgi:hypothetical protein
MREHEMRERIECAIRRATVPAAMGLTIALAGCGSTTTEPAPGASDAAAASDTGGAVALYMAQMPDAGASDAAVGVKYLAQMPDAAAADDTGGAVALYMAQMPDSGAAVRYMAQMPDSG